jgi:hypothetical protein
MERSHLAQYQSDRASERLKNLAQTWMGLQDKNDSKGSQSYLRMFAHHQPLQAFSESFLRLVIAACEITVAHSSKAAY